MKPNAHPHMTKKLRYARLVAYVNRKVWWHVPPVDAGAYKKRGKFLASSFREAEFWGRPLDEPQRVSIAKPLVGDEKSIAQVLGVSPQHADMSLEQIAATDAKWKNAALRKDYDSILLMSPRGFAEWKTTGKIPRSLELNIIKQRKT